MTAAENTAEIVWREYETGKSYFEKFGYYERAEDSWRFYNGDQWHGLKVAGDKPPILNVLAPIVDYKTATVAQNGMSINYSSLNYGREHKACVALCDRLNSHAAKTWERLKLDKVMWECLTEAAVSGDAFVYFYDSGGLVDLAVTDAVNVYLSDEQEPNVQKQRYIIIAQRLFTAEVKRQAGEAGLSEADIEMIRGDSDTAGQLGDTAKEEIKEEGESAKCLCLLKMWREGGCVHYMRCTRSVVYVPETPITGLKAYPLAHFCWIKQKGSSRGAGEIYARIPNQIEINKALARYLTVIKQCAYPHVVYNREVVRGSADIAKLLNTVGSVIGLDSPKMQKISDVISYMQPAQIDASAINIVYELERKTRELAGAGEAVTGAVNPEEASGAAIIAVRDAAALPLNAQQAGFRQFVEDIALIWFDMWRAYNPNGLEVADDGAMIRIPAEKLEKLKVEVKIDISPANPFSKYAQEQTLQNLLTAGHITFEEYVTALPDGAAAPKEKLKALLAARTGEEQRITSAEADASMRESGSALSEQIAGIAALAYENGLSAEDAAQLMEKRLADDEQ